MTLASIIERILNEKRNLPSTALSAIKIAFVIDSTPGANDYESIISTFTTSINSPILKSAARLPLTLIYISYYLINNKLLKNPPLLPLLHKYLERPRLLPGCYDDTPRLYIYSNTDSMVPSASVEQHISALSETKIPFVAEKYIGSQHVSHVRHDSTRYWGAVAAVWGRTLRQRETRKPKGKLWSLEYLRTTVPYSNAHPRDPGNRSVTYCFCLSKSPFSDFLRFSFSHESQSRDPTDLTVSIEWDPKNHDVIAVPWETRNWQLKGAHKLGRRPYK